MTAKQWIKRTSSLTLVFKVLPLVLTALGVAYIYFAPVMFVIVLIYVIYTYATLSRENYHEPEEEKYERLRNSPPPFI